VQVLQKDDQVLVSDLISGYQQADIGVDITRLFAGVKDRISLVRCSNCRGAWYQNAPSGDQTFYAQLQNHDWYYRDVKPEFQFAVTNVRPGDRLLEIGCGRGAFASLLPDRVTYRGLEFNEVATSRAQIQGLDVEKKSIEDEALQRPASYDVICHFQVLEHVSDPYAFMLACSRALKPGGLLIVAVPADNSFVGYAESAWLNMPPHHLTRWTEKALASIFGRCGIQPTQTWLEEVDEAYRGWYEAVLLRAGWLSLFGKRPRLVSTPGTHRWMYRAARLGNIGMLLRARAISRYPDIVNGHSLCVVGKKVA
jgi:2-polyprenyl-3-methyl-5-hydroxy-6-metoxy-1,4-benzoquinol methylase